MTRPKNSVILDSIHPGVLPFLARRFKSARIEQGFSRPELVREAGYSHRKLERGVARLRQLESGSSPSPDQFTLRQFAHALSIDIDELCGALYEREQALRKTSRDNGPPRFLGAMLQEAREQLGLSIRQLVTRWGLHPIEDGITKVEQLEYGEFRLPRKAELLKLAEPLHLPPEQLLQALQKEGEQLERRGKPARLVLQISPLICRPYTEEHQGDRSILEFLRYAERLATGEQYDERLVTENQCAVAVYVEHHPTIHITPEARTIVTAFGYDG